MVVDTMIAALPSIANKVKYVEEIVRLLRIPFLRETNADSPNVKRMEELARLARQLLAQLEGISSEDDRKTIYTAILDELWLRNFVKRGRTFEGVKHGHNRSVCALCSASPQSVEILALRTSVLKRSSADTQSSFRSTI
jgi:hypothetical protein